ncbi:MAG: PQQ-like beta-propeller repeat protein [Planctomycetes bacterium]|nr:PQQ-like beta-propeller repeat protein [Planctomycetota bacterium]
MLHCRNCCYGLVVVILGTVGVAEAQSSGILSPNLARRYGLDRVWATQVEVGRDRGGVVHITPHVSSIRKRTIFDVVHAAGTLSISEQQLSPQGLPFGIDGARKYAEDRVKELAAKQPANADPPRIESRDVPEITLYAATSLGAVHAIDAETGKTKWVAALGNLNYPMSEVSANDNYVAYMNGSSVFVLDSLDGKLVWTHRSAGVAAAGPAVTDTHLFLPTVVGSMEVRLLSSTRETAWHYRTAGKTRVPPVGSSDSVAWTTDNGQLIVAAADPRAIRFRLEAKQPFYASPAFAGASRVVAATVDGFVHCMDRVSGAAVWKTAVGDRCFVAPYCVQDSVLILTEGHDLVCLNLQNGLEQWRAIGIRLVLSSSMEKLYCAGDIGRIVILDNKNGTRLATVETEEFDLHVVNAQSDRIYLGNRGGTLQCLREIGNRWPIVHVNRESASDEKPATTPRTKAGQDTGDDPFATPKAKQEGDPFANP